METKGCAELVVEETLIEHHISDINHRLTELSLVIGGLEDIIGVERLDESVPNECKVDNRHTVRYVLTGHTNEVSAALRGLIDRVHVMLNTLTGR